MPEQTETEVPQKKEATGPSELEQARAEIAAARSERDNEKRLRIREARELASLRETQRRNFSAQSTEDLDEVGLLKRQLEEERQQRDEEQQKQDVRWFKTEHPEYRSEADMTPVLDLFQDPDVGNLLRTYDQRGKLDYYASLKRGHEHLELQKFRKAREKTETEGKERTRNDLNAQKLNATHSGTGAASGDETIDISGMTSDEMIDAGLVDSDPSDPIRRRRPK